MKKFLFLTTVIVFMISYLCYAKIYDMSQISQTKLVTEYSEDTTVDYMDTVTFGSYYQSNSSTKEPIEWIVLDRQGNKALLLSKYILDCKCYNEEWVDVTWETCTLRNWLNYTFYNTAFSSSEKSYIDNTYVITNDIHSGGSYASGGNNTYDNIFLLSVDEVYKYFYQSSTHPYGNKLLATRGTNYAKNGGKLYVIYRYDEWYDENSDFWLRSPGLYQTSAKSVYEHGSLNDYEGYVVDCHDGVRPALWVSNLSSSISKSNVEVVNTNDNVIWNGEYIKIGNFFLAINPITYLWIVLVVLIIIIVVYYLRKKNIKINDLIVAVINKIRLITDKKAKKSK